MLLRLHPDLLHFVMVKVGVDRICCLLQTVEETVDKKVYGNSLHFYS